MPVGVFRKSPVTIQAAARKRRGRKIKVPRRPHSKGKGSGKRRGRGLPVPKRKKK